MRELNTVTLNAFVVEEYDYDANPGVNWRDVEPVSTVVVRFGDEEITRLPAVRNVERTGSERDDAETERTVISETVAPIIRRLFADAMAAEGIRPQG